MKTKYDIATNDSLYNGGLVIDHDDKLVIYNYGKNFPNPTPPLVIPFENLRRVKVEGNPISGFGHRTSDYYISLDFEVKNMGVKKIGFTPIMSKNISIRKDLKKLANEIQEIIEKYKGDSLVKEVTGFEEWEKSIEKGDKQGKTILYLLIAALVGVPLLIIFLVMIIGISLFFMTLLSASL